MLIDTDVLIWLLRRNRKAIDEIQKAEQRNISIITYMELLQGLRNKEEMKAIRLSMEEGGFVVLPITENIGLRASIYMEEYGLKVKISLVDALLAATAVENNLTFFTANDKHFKVIEELKLRVFRP